MKEALNKFRKWLHIKNMKYITDNYKVCVKNKCKEYHGTSPSNAAFFKRHKKLFGGDTYDE